MKLFARLKRLLHCLLRVYSRKHRTVTMWVDGRVTYVGCECNRVFYISRDKGDMEAMKFMCREYHYRWEPPG